MILNTIDYRIEFELINLLDLFYSFVVYKKDTNQVINKGIIPVKKLNYILEKCNFDVFVEKSLSKLNYSLAVTNGVKKCKKTFYCFHDGKDYIIKEKNKNNYTYYESNYYHYFDKKKKCYMLKFYNSKSFYILKNDSTKLIELNNEKKYLFTNKTEIYEINKKNEKEITLKDVITDKELTFKYKQKFDFIKRIRSTVSCLNSFENYYFNIEKSLFKINFNTLKIDRIQFKGYNIFSLYTYSYIKKYDFLELNLENRKDKSILKKLIYKDSIVDKFLIHEALPFYKKDNFIYFNDEVIDLKMSMLDINKIQIYEWNISNNVIIVKFHYELKKYAEFFDLKENKSYGFEYYYWKEKIFPSKNELNKQILKIKLN